MEKRGSIISILGVKGGGGRTTVSVNLAKTFLSSGRVLLLDLDPQAKSSRYFGISQKFSIFNILNRDKDFYDVVQKTEFQNLFILPSNIDVVKVEKDDILISRVQEVTKYLETKFDFIIIDTPPYLNSLLLDSVNSAEKIIIPLKIEKLGTYFLEKSLEWLRGNQDKIKIIPTMYEDKNIDIYGDIIKNYSKYLFQFDSISLKIDKNDSYLPEKFTQLKKLVLND